MSQELCRIQTVPTVQETRDAMRKFTSMQFVTVVLNMSNVPGWNKWLCEQLDQGALERLGLNGAMIKGEVCGRVG